MEYTWKIKSLKTANANGITNAVVQTYWEKIGTDEDGNTGTFNGATPFKLAEVDPKKFTPFEELTETVVLDWIKGQVSGSYEEHVNSQIQKQIDAKKIVVKEADLPWAPKKVEEVVEETVKEPAKA